MQIDEDLVHLKTTGNPLLICDNSLVHEDFQQNASPELVRKDACGQPLDKRRLRDLFDKLVPLSFGMFAHINHPLPGLVR